MDEKQHALITEFARLLVQSTADFFSVEQIEKIIGDSPVRGIFFSTEKKGFFGRGKKASEAVLRAGDEESVRKNVADIVNALARGFGTSIAESRLEYIYTELEKRYSIGLVGNTIMPFIPADFLENHRIQYLSKEELEVQVLEKTRELRKFNDELEVKVKQRTEELQNLLAEQDRSGKLLVRRDLELTQANEKLRELDVRKSEFLSVVAHQLRTPLSGIKWTLSMILNAELGVISDDQRVFLMKSYESNDRMIELVESMLHADRIDSGKYDLNVKPTQILDLIDNVLYEILPNATRRNVTIEFNRPLTPIPQLTIDQEKMRAVFQNLLDNAVKYSRPGGTVSIEAHHVDGVVEFRVKDDGIGVPADQSALIFSRFFRARNAVKVDTDGNGLGLFIVKSIIEMHGGKIWFESREGEGTTFYFTIKI